MSEGPSNLPRIHSVSAVIPVYQGAKTLPRLAAEISTLTEVQTSPAGRLWRISELILVHDWGPDESDRVIRHLESEYPHVRPVWLSRNYGQHAATLAGMSSSGGDWVLTLDEDGQHDPSNAGVLLDAAIDAHSPVVYGKSSQPPPHGWFRNWSSSTAKRLVSFLSGEDSITEFRSFRLMTGEIARSVAAFSGAGVYLDLALQWVSPRSVTAIVDNPREEGRRSGYRLGTLVGHFWRLILTSGTRALRLVSLTGLTLAVFAAVLTVVLVIQRLLDGSVPEGWTSTVVVILATSGVILLVMGVLAEYLGIAVNMAMGRPRYLIVSDPARGPLGERPAQ